MGTEDFAIPQSMDEMRVDRAIALLLDLARGAVADLVDSGGVSINGRVVTTRSRKVFAGQILSVQVPQVSATVLGPEPDVVFDEIYVDDDLIVVDKPADLVVHPGAGHDTGTLVAGLLARYPELATITECDPERPGIVHRLDRGTSGLLVVARSARAYVSLVDQLKERTLTRRYITLAHGYLDNARGEIDAPIGRSTREPTKMAVLAGGRPARTAYDTITTYTEPLESTLLEMRLYSGRTHQIRVHLAAIGHPVVGDARYGRKEPGLGEFRQFLHAYALVLEHPGTGESVSFRSPLAADLVAYLGDVPEELVQASA